MIGLLKQDRFTEAILEVIRLVGDTLARHYPRDPDDRNELSDRIVRD